MTEPSNLRDAAEVARLIAATLGYEFDHAFRDKAEWIKERGEKGGRFHDVNEPYQTDFMYAAEEVTKAVEAATIAKVVAWLRSLQNNGTANQAFAVAIRHACAAAINAGEWKQ